MNILIAEDDEASRKYLFKLLSSYGECNMTIDGIETVEAFVMAYEAGNPYDLLCLDIMMPKIDGIRALKTIRDFEEKKGIPESQKCKVIFTSALSAKVVEFNKFATENDVYIIKPILSQQIKKALKKLNLI